MKTLLVTGTDTDVGKTWVSCALLRNLKKAGVRVGAYKPVCSGATVDAEGNCSWNDVEMLAEASGWPNNKQAICPQTFQAAVAPNIAAKMEGKAVDDKQLLQGTHAWQGLADFLLVEGAGGLLCPLSDSTTVAELAVKLDSPIVIVAANKLGMINHTLLTVEVARQRGLQIAAIIVNDTDKSAADESRRTNHLQLQHWLPGLPILTCRHSATSIDDNSGKAIAATELFGDGRLSESQH